MPKTPALPSAVGDKTSTLESDSEVERLQKIRHFRTITTLLSLIQQEPYQVTDSMKPSERADRSSLEILSAVSTLAVTHQQVVAVIAKYTLEGIDLVASTDQASQESEQPPKLLPAWKVLQNLFITYNPQRSSYRKSDPRRNLTVTGHYPSIATPSQPPDFTPSHLEINLDRKLIEYLETRFESGRLPWVPFDNLIILA